MCRIAGVISENKNFQEITLAVKVMCNELAHGGPDGQGIYADEAAGVVLGHRRLAIIDPGESGHQPMSDPGQRIWMTFNGEIYNYRELKAELLQKGYLFRSDSDTEVILQAYLCWGTAAFSKIEGMFAFALYDTVNSSTYLVRDSAGIKPLYYHHAGNQLAFASEVRAFQTAGIAVIEDKRWPVWLLSYGHIPEPYTTLEHVKSLPKGCFLCWRYNRIERLESYLPSGVTFSAIRQTGDAEDGIRNHLQSAVKRQLVSDAEIGVFLSGGIDSSILALLAGRVESNLKTISIFFDEKAYDERSFQQEVSQQLKGENFQHLVKKADFDHFLPEVIQAMDMPTTDGINSWFISKYAHDDGLKSVLSGIGADELFGGYPSFNRIKYLPHLKKIPGGWLTRAGRYGNGNYKRLAYLAYNHPAADYLFLRGLFCPSDIAGILNMEEKEVTAILFADNRFPDLGAYDRLHAAWFETNMYMQNQLLRDTDVMSMSHGLEVRVPYLDEVFLSYTNRIAPDIKYHADRPKKILIDSFKNILPQAVWDRPKMGFTFPLQEWMKTNREIGDESLYTGKLSKRLVHDFKDGRAHWSKIFALFQTQRYV